MPQTHSQKGSGRTPRLSSLLSRKVAEYFKAEMDLPGLVSISFVDVSPNMQSATVWLSIYAADEDEVMQKLKAEKGPMRRYLTKELRTKYIPMLKFKIDSSQEHAQNISEALKSLDE